MGRHIMRSLRSRIVGLLDLLRVRFLVDSVRMVRGEDDKSFTSTKRPQDTCCRSVLDLCDGGVRDVRKKIDPRITTDKACNISAEGVEEAYE